MKSLFYYLRDSERRPVVTICILVDNNKILSRGIAICSKNDMPCKRTGRRISLERASWSAKKKLNNGIIKRKRAYLPHADIQHFYFKNAYKPEKTVYEKELLEGKE